MRRLRHVFIPAAAVGAGIALSACGGDSSPETPIVVPTETQQASQGGADFIAQADSICAEANSSIEQFASAGQGLTEADQIADLRQGVVDQIQQLNPPSDTNLDAFLAAMTDQVDAGKKIGLALQRGEDTAQFESELDSAKSEAETAAASYGFKECGQQITSSGTSTSSSSSSSGAVVPSEPSTAAPPSSDTTGGSVGGGTDSGTDSGSSGTGSGTGGTSGSSGGVGPG